MITYTSFRNYKNYLSVVIFSTFFLFSFSFSTSAQDVPEPNFQSGLPDPLPDFSIVDFLPEFGGFPRHAVGKLDTIDLGDGAYVITEGVYQALVLVGQEGVILVDAPPSLGTAAVPTGTGETLLDAIDIVSGGLPIKHLVYSHEHKDHIGAAQVIVDAFPDVKIYAHSETLKLLQRAHADDPFDSRPFPNRIIRKHDRKIYQDQQKLVLSHRGPAHAPGDLYIWAPRQKILMLVDVVFPKWVPFANLAITKDIRGYIQAHEEILSFDFNHFVGGHLTRIGDRADVELAQEYVLAVRDAMGTALATVGFGDISDEEAVTSEDEANLYFSNVFALFDEWLQDISQVCTDIVQADERFAGLAALDVFTNSHCFTMQLFLRVD